MRRISTSKKLGRTNNPKDAGPMEIFGITWYYSATSAINALENNNLDLCGNLQTKALSRFSFRGRLLNF